MTIETKASDAPSPAPPPGQRKKRSERIERRMRSGPLERYGSLAPRVVTALLLAPFALASVLFGGWFYALVIAVMTVAAIWEWTRLVVGAEFQRGFYVLAVAGVVAVYLTWRGDPLAALVVGLVGGVVATLLEWPKRNPDSWPAVGAGYLITPAIAAVWLRNIPEEGRVLTIMLFAVVWGADSGAYVFGKNIGGPKLAPRISPGKTWAGAIGGVVTGAVVAAIIAALAGLPGVWFWTLVGGALAIASVAGDLAESQLKRSYGVKDSGSAFPGHGGVLDRLDGFLFAAAALAALVLIRQYG